MKKNTKNNSQPEPRINDELRGNYDVRAIYPDGENTTTQVMPLTEAKRLANKLELDLIEINPAAFPPLVKIADYSKFLYEEKKKAKANKQKKIELKEIQLSTNIAANDLNVKAKKAMQFIAEGDKVKVVLTMRQRELTRREESEKALYEFLMLVSEVAVPESMPKAEGPRTMVILKKKKN